MIVGRVKTEIDIETLLHWAFRDELSKKQTSSAEGIWDRIEEDGRRGGIDRGHGAAQRYSHFGLPDPDAERIEKAVAGLEDMVIDWRKSFDAIAGELSGLISVNDLVRQEPRAPKAGWGAAGAKAVKAFFGEVPRAAHDRSRDLILVGGLNVAVLVTVHAIKGARPDWIEDAPLPKPTPAERGTNAKIFGECRGRNLYSYGAYCPLRWTPSPLSIVTSRADYVAWHHGLTVLAANLQTEKFTPLPPKASRTPWLEAPEPETIVRSVVPTPSNGVAAWGTLPLVPHRDRKGPALRRARAGPVRYPLREACP